VFVLLTNPVSSHALARAAHSIHTPEADETVIDQLEEEELGEARDASVEDKA
jgi:multicomponent Na+:H+ antiporter subunit G